jgi:hypothetical protein
MHRKRSHAENDVPRAGSSRRSRRSSRWNLSFRQLVATASAMVALVSVGTVLGISGVASAASLPCPTGATCALGYVALASPTRIADTRTVAQGGSTNAYNGQTLSAGHGLAISAASAVPPAASAIVVNVTAVGPTNAGFLTVYPTGATLPTAANIDFAAGQTVGNEVTVGLDASQSFTVYYGPAGSGTVNFTADVMGYYEAETTGGSFYVPVTPTRIYDSRTGSGQTGAGTTLTNGGSDNVTVAGVGGVPTSANGTTAVVLNVAITNPTAFSFMYAYPKGSTAPLVANQNYTAGETLSSQVVATVNSSNQVTIANHTGNVDIVVDVDGYYTSDGTTAGASLLSTLPTPIRLFDDRNNIPAGTSPGVAGGKSAVAPANLSTFSSPYNAGLGASAYALSIADIASGGNYLTAYATGTSLPTVANVNYTGGDAYNVVENAAYAGVDANGEVSVQNGPNAAASAHIVVDEDAYFVPQPFTVQVFAVPYPNTTTTPGTTSVSIPATIPADGTSQAEFFVNTQNLGLLGNGGAIDFSTSGTSGCTASQFVIAANPPGLPAGATPGYDIIYTSNTAHGTTCTLNVTVPGETATGSATVNQT